MTSLPSRGVWIETSLRMVGIYRVIGRSLHGECGLKQLRKSFLRQNK